MKRADGLEWPVRVHWFDLAWAVFAVANLVAMAVWADWETVPFHFIWVSLTILYGFRVWRTGRTLLVLGVVVVATALVMLHDYAIGAQPLDELTEVPLMAAMFVAMVWHARRRLTATEKLKQVSDTNLRLLQREQRFVQDASHELRTPITVALGHSEMIQRTTTDPTIAEDARVVSDELMRLGRLADRLLLLASTDDPGFGKPAAVELAPMVADALQRWAPTPRRWTLGSLHEATVTAYPDGLALAIDALIENAVKHSSVADTIELSVRVVGSTAVLAVADSGEGIDPSDVGRIFDRFARADVGRSRERGGIGLGLAIVKAVAEAQGGSVQVRSAPGAGSTFELTLPLRNGSSPAPAAPRDQPEDGVSIPGRTLAPGHRAAKGISE